MSKRYFSFLILLCVFIASNDCFSQREEEFYKSKDSVYRYQGIIPPVEFQYNLDEIFSKPISNQVPENILFDDNTSAIWLRTQLLISYNRTQSSSVQINTQFTSQFKFIPIRFLNKVKLSLLALA